MLQHLCQQENYTAKNHCPENISLNPTEDKPFNKVFLRACRIPSMRSPRYFTRRFNTCDPLTAYPASTDPTCSALSPVNCIFCASLSGSSTFAIESGTPGSASPSSTACVEWSSSVTYTRSFACMRFNSDTVSANPI